MYAHICIGIVGQASLVEASHGIWSSLGCRTRSETSVAKLSVNTSQASGSSSSREGLTSTCQIPRDALKPGRDGISEISTICLLEAWYILLSPMESHFKGSM